MARRLHTLLPALLCLTSFSSAWGQTDTLQTEETAYQVLPEEKGALSARVDALLFMCDNEYKSDLTKGYTLPGYWIQPTLVYQPLGKLRLELGAHMLHFWGADTYPRANYASLATLEGKSHTRAFHCLPTFRANMQLTPRYNIILGTLYGKGAHRLSEPLYNEELDMTADPETGAQFLVNHPAVWLDVWVNWDSFIYKGDSGQESFTFGLSTRLRPSRRKARAQWYIPLQILFRHIGGEINTEAADRTVKTWMNTAGGAGLDLPLRTRIPASLNLEAVCAYYKQNSGAALPFQSGYSLYATATARVWRFDLTAGYWHGRNFVSIYGSPFFSTYSLSEQSRVKKPHLFVGKIAYTQHLGKAFVWGAKAGLYLQPACSTYTQEGGWTEGKTSANLTVSMYLRCSPSFLIKKFK